MALIATAPTLAQIEGVTRNSLLKRFLRETQLGTYGTVTAGTDATTSINDTTKLKSTQYNSNEWVGGWARISKDAGGAAAAPETEISAITTYDPSTNGRITVNPAFTASPTTSDEYELWRINPRDVLDILDEILQEELHFPCWTLLSEIPDYDMEQNNTTDWTASGATVTKQTGEILISGKRYLRIAPASANDYARTASFRVIPNKQYLVAAIARCEVGQASGAGFKLQFYDVTNSAEIGNKVYRYTAPGIVTFTTTVPATCHSAQIRLISTTTDTVEADEVIVYALDSNDIALPWWVKDKNQVKGIFRLNPQEIESNVWENVLVGELDRGFDIRDTSFGRDQLRLVSRRGAIGDTPLFIFGLRNETAYANDNSDKKYIDATLLVSLLAYKVFSMIAPPASGDILDADWYKEQVAVWKHKYETAQAMFTNRIQEVIQSDTPWAEYSSEMSYGLF